MDVSEVDRREVFRYMGCKGVQEGLVGELVEKTLEELGRVSEPKHLTASFPVKLLPDQWIDSGCFQVQSRNLSKNLKDCHRMILFAATLGAGADHLIRRYSRLEMSRAVIAQAASAAMIEEYCDQVCKELKEELEQQGEYAKPRFSPGYGDFPLSCQESILEVLQAGKRIGIKLTEGFLMLPTKSVTAVIGVSRKPHRCEVKGCEACGKKDCSYRRS